MLVRPATLEDLDTLVYWGKRLTDESPWFKNQGFSAERAKKLFAHLIDKLGSILIVMDHYMNPVGGLIGVLDTDWRTGQSLAFEQGIYVLPEYRNTGAAAIRFIDCNRFYCGGNIIRNLTGAAGFVYRVSGNSKDWTIDDDDIIRTVAGAGYIFHILGAENIGGRIRRNRLKADGVKGWDWYIYSDNLAQFSTHDNELESSGTNYIYQGANVTAGDDTVNNSRNYWPSIPTAFKSRVGQIATIANIQKTWTGTAWVSANSVAVTYDPPSIDAGASVNTNVAVQGAVFGDFAQASFSAYDQNIEISAVVSGTNQVTVKFKNIGASPVDLASGTLRVRVS